MYSSVASYLGTVSCGCHHHLSPELAHHVVNSFLLPPPVSLGGPSCVTSFVGEPSVALLEHSNCNSLTVNGVIASVSVWRAVCCLELLFLGLTSRKRIAHFEGIFLMPHSCLPVSGYSARCREQTWVCDRWEVCAFRGAGRPACRAQHSPYFGLK